MRPLQAFLALPAAEKRAALVALGLLPYFALTLHLLPWRRLRDDAPLRAGGRGLAARVDPLRAARLVDAVAASLPLRPRCLARSLALRSLLRRQGVDARLRLGVRKDGSLLDAHAWVEADGVMVGEAGEGYAPLAVGGETPGRA